MTKRERDLVREAVARTRHEMGGRAAPGPDSWRTSSGGRVTLDDAAEITEYVRASLRADFRTMRRFGRP